ncbi:N-formylglutamate amidohydrolase [Thermodesulfobacteriota bacterium]
MKLPLLLSVPHAGLLIPPQVLDTCLLENKDIVADSDEGAAEIYLPLKNQVMSFVTTDVARAVVDMNRREDDFRKDGVVKTHTCWDVPIYREPLPEETAYTLIEMYHRPYHDELERTAKGAVLGVDCHTMVAQGPPVGPDPGEERPSVCLSNADGTCPEDWLHRLADCFQRAFKLPISINKPFKGGYIIHKHSSEIPWIQVELSRAPFMTLEEKSELVFQALQNWCTKIE